MKRCRYMPMIFGALFALSCSDRAGAGDYITYTREGKTANIEGKVTVETPGGGVMLLAPDGTLWNLPSSQINDRRHDDRPFVPLTAERLGQQLLAELPPGFEIHTTAHYLICHNTSKAFAQWVGSLFERLYTAFTNYWTQRGVQLRQPAQPLVVVIYADKSSYDHFSTEDLRGNSDLIIGYYSLRSNRVSMYDMTGIESLRLAGDKRGTTAQINQILRRPKAAAMIATVVHEATHQIAFNCGLQQRFADNPLWFTEGLAMYFESPDLAASKGWRTLGEVNRHRLTRFLEYYPRRPEDSLKTLITDDKRFRDANLAIDAYAEGWALTYFLMRQHSKEYQLFLTRNAAKDPLERLTADQRLAEFKACFGNDLHALDDEFMRYMARVQ